MANRARVGYISEVITCKADWISAAYNKRGELGQSSRKTYNHSLLYRPLLKHYEAF